MNYKPTRTRSPLISFTLTVALLSCFNRGSVRQIDNESHDEVTKTTSVLRESRQTGSPVSVCVDWFGNQKVFARLRENTRVQYSRVLLGLCKDYSIATFSLEDKR